MAGRLQFVTAVLLLLIPPFLVPPGSSTPLSRRVTASTSVDAADDEQPETSSMAFTAPDSDSDVNGTDPAGNPTDPYDVYDYELDPGGNATGGFSPGSSQNSGGSSIRPVTLSCNLACISMNRAMVRLLNIFRAQNGGDAEGRSGLCLSNKLLLAARAHTRDMYVKRYFNHADKYGRFVNYRVSASGFKWRSVAENIAKGYGETGAVFWAWSHHAGHRDNMLGPYTHTAVYQIGGKWTQVFAKKRYFIESCSS